MQVNGLMSYFFSLPEDGKDEWVRALLTGTIQGSLIVVKKYVEDAFHSSKKYVKDTLIILKALEMIIIMVTIYIMWFK